MAVTFALIALFGGQNKYLMYFSLCAFIYVLAVLMYGCSFENYIKKEVFMGNLNICSAETANVINAK